MPNPIEPTTAETIWGIASVVVWILLLLAIVMVANWILNRIVGKPIRWPRRWAQREGVGL